MPHASSTSAKPVALSADPSGELAFARAVIADEAAALSGLAGRLGPELSAAVDVLERCVDAGGTILVTGLGKSGLIGAKISATLASLGIPSHSVHPAEAAHGDLGRFRASDAVLALSASGETDEVVNLAAIVRQDGLPVVAIVGGLAGGTPPTLARLATATLHLGELDEAGGEAFDAPTTSTTAMLALGDAIALCLARRRNHTPAEFAKRHPGGALGGLLKRVGEILRFKAGENLPLIPESASVRAALEAAARVARRPGAMLLVDAAGKLTGIFTDGDLRRLILRDARELDRPVCEVMTRTPRTLPESALVRDAVTLVREHRADEIPVVDATGRPVGILDVQDLIAMRLVRA